MSSDGHPPAFVFFRLRVAGGDAREKKRRRTEPFRDPDALSYSMHREEDESLLVALVQHGDTAAFEKLLLRL
jgi:hypothetical protein